jgi:hypothetical protein
MTTGPRTLVGRFPHVAALFVAFGCVCFPSQAFAQGGLAVTITSPAPDSTVAGTTTVKASVTLAGTSISGGGLVAGVQFKLDGVNLGAEDTKVPYEVPWDTTTASNGLHTLTAVARDTVGIRYTSNPIRVTVLNGLPTETRFEETELATSYTVGWVHAVDGRPFSGGTVAYAPKMDGRATFTFIGTSVKWIGFRGPQSGMALVFLDGNFVAQVDTYSPTEEVKAVIFSADGLQHGTHRLWIEVTGQKNPAATDALVVVDAFDVAPPSPPPTFTSGKRFEQTSSSVGYTPGWTQGDTTTAWSGGTAAASATPGARATFAFTGTSVNWIGLRGPSAGIAYVFLDGTFRAAVDLYEPTRLQAVVFSASGLENTSHTMVIEAAGQHNSMSSGSAVTVDAFDTRARFEETHPSIAYADYWEATVSRAWSDRTAVFTWVAGARATLTFTSTSVRWIGYRGPIGGIARVYMDGNFVAQIDTYSADEDVKGVTYEAKGLAAGSHTLTIAVTGEMNPLAQKPFVALDAFDINF